MKTNNAAQDVESEQRCGISRPPTTRASYVTDTTTPTLEASTRKPLELRWPKPEPGDESVLNCRGCGEVVCRWGVSNKDRVRTRTEMRKMRRYGVTCGPCGRRR